MSDSYSINEFTFTVNLPRYMDNLAENLPIIRDKTAGDVKQIPKREEPAIIIGAGPSLKKLNHLKMISESGWKHPIFCCDKMLADCLKEGVVPYVVGSVDPSPKIHGFYTQGIVRKYAPEIYAAFSVFTHPSIINTWLEYHGRINWYLTMVDEPAIKNKVNIHSQTIMLSHLIKHKTMLSGIGNVGATLWNIATAITTGPIILVGFDFSEQVLDVADAIYFNQFVAGFLRQDVTNDPKEAQDKAAAMHKLEENPDFISNLDDGGYYYRPGLPVRYLTNRIWREYRLKFAEHIRNTKVLTINATGGGSLHTAAKEKIKHPDGAEVEEYILKCDNFKTIELAEVLKTYA